MTLDGSQCGGEESEQVAGDQSGLSQFSGRQVTCKAMDVDAQGCRIEWSKPLPGQRRDQSRQYVARAASGHTGISRSIDVHIQTISDD